MSSATVPRPRHTTLAGALVMGAGVFIVIAAFDRVANLRSVETRESLQSVIDDLPAGYQPTLENVIQFSHGAAIVSALCAVAAVALGWQVLQGSRPARTVLAVLAAPIFLTGLVAGGFMSSVLVVASVMLWLSPSREWFAGKPIPERFLEAATPTRQKPAQPPVEPTSAASAPTTGWGAPPMVGPAAPSMQPRPNAITVALVVTIVGAGLVFFSSVVTLFAVVVQPDLMLDELRRTTPQLDAQGVSDQFLLTAARLSGGVTFLASLAAMVLAALTARRRAWAARGLLILSVLCAVFCLLSAIASPVALIPGIAAIVTISRLRHPEARAWLTR